MAKDNERKYRRGKRPAAPPVVLPALPEFRAPKTNEGYLDAHGREKPDPTPMAPPIGYQKTEPLHVRIKRMVQSELSQRAADEGFDTWEEDQDFDVDDDYDPSSPYEETFDPEEPLIAEPKPKAEAPKATPGDDKAEPKVDPPKE